MPTEITRDDPALTAPSGDRYHCDAHPDRPAVARLRGYQGDTGYARLYDGTDFLACPECLASQTGGALNGQVQ